MRRNNSAARMVIAACAASAGAHAALVPEHLRESPALGASFVLSVVLLLAAVVALTIRPDDRRAGAAAALLLSGLIVAWVLSRTTGLPGLEPEPEPADAVSVVTKLVEGVGLAFALHLALLTDGRRSSATQEVTR